MQAFPSPSARAVESLRAAYPVFHRLDTDRLRADIAACPVVRVAADRPVFDEGASCAGFPLLLEGEVRVARATAHGREIELYRVRPGDFCIVSAACLFGGNALPARAHTVRDTEVLIVSRETFLAWTDDRQFRAAVIASLADRLSDLMGLIDLMLSQRLDSRLAATLLRQGPLLTHTHQRLADELGTSREIVSRLLKRLEDQTLVRLGRGRIEVLDPAGLRSLAGALYPESQTGIRP